MDQKPSGVNNKTQNLRKCIVMKEYIKPNICIAQLKESCDIVTASQFSLISDIDGSYNAN